MTRKDYQAIAQAIRDERATIEARECDLRKVGEQWATTTSLAVRIALVFEADNERFDRQKFYEACGI
jgi:hypothetical protein